MTSLGIRVTHRGLVEVPVLNWRQNEHCVFGPQPGGGRFYMLLTLEDSSHPPPLVHFPVCHNHLWAEGQLEVCALSFSIQSTRDTLLTL